MSSYPSEFYLNNVNLGTAAKLQNPWADCWAFAIASALESSILKASSDKQAASETSTAGLPPIDPSVHAAPKLSELVDTVDISERALAWFSHELQTEASGGAQAGEGYSLLEPDNPHNQLVEGSFSMIESQLVARQMLVTESAAPYQYNNYAGSPKWFSLGSRPMSASDARTYDWSLDAQLRTYEDVGWYVDEVYKLPSSAVLDTNPTTGVSRYIGYNPTATRAIKGALLQVGAVAVALESDLAIPEEVISGSAAAPSSSAHFDYTTWSQFNSASEIFCNHAVSIVGWDDSYSAANFSGTESGRPAGDGAWLCKNNWGSDMLYAALDSYGDAIHWGLPDEQGAASGFFWVSYYDHSLSDPTAFGVSPTDESPMKTYQYDYLGAAEYSAPTTYNSDVWVANAFATDSTQLLKAISAQTFSTDETVSVAVYTLPRDLDLSVMSASAVFERAQLQRTQATTFEQAGIHTLELEKPLVIPKGSKFIVAEKVSAERMTAEGKPYHGTYLNLEMAYLQNTAETPASIAAKVVSNPGETFVSLNPGTWITVHEFNTDYARAKENEGKPVDAAFGNALIKAYTNDTTMAQKGQIYEVRRVQ